MAIIYRPEGPAAWQLLSVLMKNHRSWTQGLVVVSNAHNDEFYHVYTVNQESKYLLVQGVPTVGAKTELVKLFGSYGDIQEVRTLDDYPTDRFTEVYLINYKRIQSARIAKRRLDDWSFYGGVLHVCYAPEYESVQETREKLKDRRKTVAAKIKQYRRDGTYSSSLRETQSDTTASQSHDQQTLPSYLAQTSTVTNSGFMNGHEHAKLTQTDFLGQRTCYDDFSRPLDNHASTHQVHNHQNVSLNADSNLEEPRNPAFRPPYQNFSVERTQRNNSQICFSHPNHDLSVQNLLRLPPPPTQSSTVQHQHTATQNYGFARVPSAQSGFPPDFDARIDKFGTNDSKDTEESNPELDIDNGSTKTSISTVKDKTVQEKINEHLKKDKVVIKNFTQKGPAPRFIPRQMKNKVKPPDKADIDKDVSNKDEISKELRRNAFTLREVQGPEDIHTAENKGPVLQIASVEQSMKEIRKRVSQFSDRSSTDKPTKIQKTL